MVEIKLFRSPVTPPRLRHIFCVLLLFVMPVKVNSQQVTPAKQGTTRIEIQHADSGEQNMGIDPDLTRFLGNIKIKHNDVFMFCDSAYYYKTKNQVRAFSKVHIIQGDTLNLYGNYLFYDGTNGNAFVKGNVELIDKESARHPNGNRKYRSGNRSFQVLNVHRLAPQGLIFFDRSLNLRSDAQK
jgi:lipopolysaccharide assembly outer membrane protein LptD (OstA)